jgi:hypothetical protein
MLTVLASRYATNIVLAYLSLLLLPSDFLGRKRIHNVVYTNYNSRKLGIVYAT